MAVDALTLDSLIAGLHDALARAADVAAASESILERCAADLGLPRAALIVQTDNGPRGAVRGLPSQQSQMLIQELAGTDPPLLNLHDWDAEPAAAPTGSFPLLAFRSTIVFTFAGLDAESPFGVVLLDAQEISDTVMQMVRVMASLGPGLERVAQRAALTERSDRFARQRDLLTTIVNTLPDPVLLTDPDNDILLSNRRAEMLFTSHVDDSEGRRRAIQVNNLLFSSFLTQTLIGAGRSAARELNLVDTQEGSDLLFEVLSLPIDVGGQAGVVSVLRDITDLRHAVSELEVQFNRSREAEREARQERDRLNVILENVSDPILVTDDQTNIVLMNPEADRLFVVDDNSGGRVARKQIQANDTRFTTLISNFMLRDEHRQVERIAIVDPQTGTEFPAEVASSKIFNPRGEPIAIVSVVHDLTQAEDNERLARELQQLNDQLEDRIRRATLELEERNRRLEWQSFELQKASRLKSEFLANMSHELRTPINVILGYTSLMRERIYGALTEQQGEALTKTYHTSQHLLELINDILDLSKIEAGKMPLHLETVQVPEVVAELSESVLPMVRSKGLLYTTEIATDLPPLHTDRTKLKQVLLNLLSNAIKFTHDGGIKVVVAPLEGRDGVRIRVADTGIGIRQDDMDAIFDDFRQIDQSRTREHGGTGLGLSITKKLLTLLGGVISVESTYGTGTRFTIDLPSVVDETSDTARTAGSLTEP